MTPIVGLRFKCSVCNDYDLCQNCEKKGAEVHTASHPLLKITAPRRHFGPRGCPYFRNNEHANTNRLLARFVADVTIMDNTAIDCGNQFVKIWKIRNESEVAWPENTSLTFVGGDQLGAPESVIVPSVAPRAEIDIAVSMTAPSSPGRYVSYWRLCTPDGIRFGQRVWVDIFAVEPKPAGTFVSAMMDVSPAVSQPEPVELAKQPEPVLAAPVPSAPSAPESSPLPAPVDEPMAVEPVKPAEPQAEESVGVVTAEEIQCLKLLVEMGFKGNLLYHLRVNKCNLEQTIRDILEDSSR